LAEARDQQIATSEVLQVVNSSPGDLAPVFDAMLEKATRLCEASFGTLHSYDGQQWRPAALYHASPLLAELWLSVPPPPGPNSPLTRIIAGEDAVHIEDLAASAGYAAGEPRARAFVDLGGARSVVVVALRKERMVLGSITVYRQEVRSFTDKQIALLQNFAAQAVIAMENARLLSETREALEQQTATAEVLQVINSSPGDLAPVFEAMLEKAVRLCEFPFAALWTYDGTRFAPVAFHNMPPAFGSFLREHTPPGLEALRDAARPMHFPDVLATGLAQRDPLLTQKVQELGRVRTLLLVPLRRENALLGGFVAYRQEVRPFTDKQITLLENFAAQAVIAMENARLITETREALEQQTATAEVLGVINSSPGNLAPVFDTMLDKAMRLCKAHFGSLWTLNGDRFLPTASRGVPAPYAGYLAGEVPAAGPGTGRSRLLAGEPFAHIVDLADEEPYRAGEPHRRALVDLGGARTALLVPLRKDEAVIGFIMIYRQEVRPFTGKQIALLQNFAAQAVIAMENARLLGELRARTDEIAGWNLELEARVATQLDELGRVGRLKRFLAPQLAELIVSQGDEEILESHRREIVVVFCDLRGYTAFTETAEPEEVLNFLREYHGALGPLVSQYEGTLDQFSGDGIMVFFNDPVPCPDPAERAVKMAIAMREEAGKLIATWRRDGCELGFGAGIAQGYATLGQIGFSERSGYTAIGTVCNLAARLCGEAKDGQILISSRVARAVEAVARLEDVGNLELKGLRRPVAAFNVVQSTIPAEARSNLTVVARGPGA
jgi:adenylate cyclase